MKPTTIILILSIIAFAACKKKNNCEGIPGNISVTGATPNASSDTVTAFNSIYTHTMQLLPKQSIENGGIDGNCPDYVAPTQKAERIETKDMELYCNKDLRHKGITVNAGENILKRDDVFQVNIYLDRDAQHPDKKFFSSASLLIQTDSLQSGTHIFYVKGTTTIGNAFMDSVAIYYH